MVARAYKTGLAAYVVAEALRRFEATLPEKTTVDQFIALHEVALMDWRGYCSSAVGAKDRASRP
jgi:hypothetical protein